MDSKRKRIHLFSHPKVKLNQFNPQYTLSVGSYTRRTAVLRLHQVAQDVEAKTLNPHRFCQNVIIH